MSALKFISNLYESSKKSIIEVNNSCIIWGLSVKSNNALFLSTSDGYFTYCNAGTINWISLKIVQYRENCAKRGNLQHICITDIFENITIKIIHQFDKLTTYPSCWVCGFPVKQCVRDKISSAFFDGSSRGKPILIYNIVKFCKIQLEYVGLFHTGEKYF